MDQDSIDKLFNYDFKADFDKIMANSQYSHFIDMLLEKAMIRKNQLDDFSSINTSGKIAMKLDTNDKIVGVTSSKSLYHSRVILIVFFA